LIEQAQYRWELNCLPQKLRAKRRFERPAFPQKSPRFPQKSPMFPQKEIFSICRGSCAGQGGLPKFPKFPQISAKEPCIFEKEPYVSANKVRFTICCRSCAGEGGLCVHMNVGVDLGEGAGVGVDAGGCS